MVEDLKVNLIIVNIMEKIYPRIVVLGPQIISSSFTFFKYLKYFFSIKINLS